MELISFHRYIKNTFTNGMICTERLLNTDKRPQLSKRARKAQCNKVGQKKNETKNERERHWMGPVPGEGAVKEERFLYPGKSSHQQGEGGESAGTEGEHQYAEGKRE